MWNIEFDVLDENSLPMHVMNLGSLAEIMDPKDIGDEALVQFKKAMEYLASIQQDEWRLETEARIKKIIE
jgi:hypothetical protein